MGSSARQASDGREMARGGSFISHKSSGATSCLVSSSMFCKTRPQYHYPDEIGQCHCSDIHQQTRESPLTPALSACPNHRAYRGKYFHLPGKDNVLADQESRLMKDQCYPSSIKSNSRWDTRDRHARFQLTKQLSRFYNWRPDPEAQGTDTFHQDWSQMRGFTNPLWCLIARCLSQVKRQVAQVVVVTPLWTSQPWYPTILWMLDHHPVDVGGFTQNTTSPRRPSGLANRTSIHNKSAGSGISGMAHIPESFTSKGISAEASNLMLSSWRPKTTIHCWQSSLAGVHKGIGIPLRDLYRGHNKFLAELFREGYSDCLL